MANAANLHKDATDLVKLNEILKAQVALEEKARREWQRKWGFLLNFDKFVVEEAAKHGVSEEEYRRWTVKLKDKSKTIDPVWDLSTCKTVPKTSSGIVGWRQNTLERLGPLYVSPLHTLPPKEKVFRIYLN